MCFKLTISFTVQQGNVAEALRLTEEYLMLGNCVNNVHCQLLTYAGCNMCCYHSYLHAVVASSCIYICMQCTYHA